jgi:phage tail sheath protein FI
MPTYKAPGVYVEEKAAGALRIANPAETIVAFVGPGPAPIAALGTVAVSGAIFRSFVAFTDSFGRVPPQGSGSQIFWLAVEGFFLEGGTALVVAWAADSGLPAFQAALATLEAVPGISLVAAPGAAAANDDGAAAITQALIDHAAKTNRFAVLESPPGLSMAEVLQWRARFSSDRAALYYPWIRIAPAGGTAVLQPPSGHVAGIFVRTDQERGIWKSPASEVVRSATGLAVAITGDHQAPLNDAGINCIRDFPNRGILVFGARTMGSDPEYRYVNVRRLVSMIQRSIGGAFAAATFEFNDDALWARVREGAGVYLSALWRAGALQGAKPENAYFVRCDRTSMTQNDLDNGRLVCEIGVAPIRPAEFIIFRVAQLIRNGAA